MPIYQLTKSIEKHQIILALILLVFFIKGLFLVSLFPIFQGPDEQIHYATIQYNAEPKEKNWEIKDSKAEGIFSEIDDIQTQNVSEEIKKAAEITKFDEVRWHKSNSLSFSRSEIGPQEDKIKNNDWKRYVDIYPATTIKGISLYHSTTSLFEKLLSGKDIFVRFFSARIFSLLIGIGILVLIFKISSEVGLSRNASLLATAIISFQPMFSFISSIINRDVLLIFSFTLFFYIAVLIIKDGANWISTLILILSALLGTLTKGPGIILFLITYLIISYSFFKISKVPAKKFFTYFLLISIVVALSVFVALPDKYANRITQSKVQSEFSSPIQSIGKYIEETMNLDDLKATTASYWGHFGWLDAKIADSVVDIIWFGEVIFLIAVLVYLAKRKGSSTIPIKKEFIVLFLISILALQFAIRFFDWRIFDITSKIQIGTPGRYFIPNIVPHFLIIFAGIFYLVKEKYFEFSLKLILILVTLLQFYSIFTLIIPRYYL